MLSPYELNGRRFQLDEKDAKRLGATPVSVKAAPAPKNKGRRPADKHTPEPTTPTPPPAD